MTTRALEDQEIKAIFENIDGCNATRNMLNSSLTNLPDNDLIEQLKPQKRKTAEIIQMRKVA